MWLKTGIWMLQPPQVPRCSVPKVPIAIVPGVARRERLGGLRCHRCLRGETCRLNTFASPLLTNLHDSASLLYGHDSAKAMLFIIFIRKHLHLYKAINSSTERVLVAKYSGCPPYKSALAYFEFTFWASSWIFAHFYYTLHLLKNRSTAYKNTKKYNQQYVARPPFRYPWDCSS